VCGAPAVANDEPCCMGVTAGGAGAARRAVDKPIAVVEGRIANAVSGYERLNVRDRCERDVCVCLYVHACVCVHLCVYMQCVQCVQCSQCSLVCTCSYRPPRGCQLCRALCWSMGS